MLPVEMMAKAINFLSTILVSAGLAVGHTETGAAMVEVTLTVGNLLLGASGSSSAIDKGASKTTTAAARTIHFKGAPWHRSAGKAACGRTSLGRTGNYRIVPKEEYSGSLR